MYEAFVCRRQLGEKRRRIPSRSSLLSFVPPVDSWCPPQMIELIHNYERFAPSIYLLCPDEHSITPPPVFSKHHECLMAGNLLPTSDRRPNPDTCNTVLIFCCFNTATSSPQPLVYSRNWCFETEISNHSEDIQHTTIIHLKLRRLGCSCMHPVRLLVNFAAVFIGFSCIFF